MIYLDFDGVVVDTWPLICEHYKKIYNTDLIEEVKLKKLFANLDWGYVLDNGFKNQQNIRVLQQLSNKSIRDRIKILTKVNSIEEKQQKALFLKRNNIKFEMVAVVFEQSKTDVVDPTNNLLIDDEIKNLDEWEKKGGKAILYTKNDNNCDSDGIQNFKYNTISILSKDIFEAKDLT